MANDVDNSELRVMTYVLEMCISILLLQVVECWQFQLGVWNPV